MNIIDIPIAIFWGLIAYLYSMMVFSSTGLIIEIFYSSPKIESKIKNYFPTFLKCSVYSLIMALVIVLCSKYLLIDILLAKKSIVLSVVLYMLILFYFEYQIFLNFTETLKSFTNKLLYNNFDL